jgi:hypothetical protein
MNVECAAAVPKIFTYLSIRAKFSNDSYNFLLSTITPFSRCFSSIITKRGLRYHSSDQLDELSESEITGKKLTKLVIVNDGAK